jgi:hypothetical protein
VLKQFAMAVTAAMVLASVGAGAAAAEDGAGHRVERLHQHQGVRPGGISTPGTHHHQDPHEPGGRHGHGRPSA